MNKISMSLALAALLMYGCSNKPEESETEASTTQEVAKPAAEQTLANEDAIEENLYGTTTKQVAAQHTMPQQSAAQVTTTPHTGTVLETMDAAGYTYAKVNEDGNVYWIAGPKTAIAAGDTISFTEQMVMQDFTSKTLNKTFDYLVFANTIVPADASTAAKTAHAAAALPATKEAKNCDDCGSKEHNTTAQKAVATPAKATPPAATEVIKVAKLPDGYTIEELYAQKSDLNGTTVSLNAKVVKVSKNIMGKDWVHLQDGSTANDITVTGLNTTVAVGDTVTAKGTLKTDVDFGYGYFFPVIIEESTFIVK